MRDLRNWDSSSQLSAAHLQEPVEALRELADAKAYEAAQQEGKIRQFVVLTITDEGPDSKPDLDGNAYWAKISYIAGGEQGSPLTINPDLTENPPESEGDDAQPVVIAAYNQAEEADGSHLLATDESVHVVAWVIQDYGDPSRTRYLFDHAPDNKALFGKLKAPGWAPGDNTVDLQPCVSATDGTTLKKADGVTDQDPVTGVYIVMPTTSVVPCFQPQTGDILAYRKLGDVYLLDGPALFPVPQNQYEVILAVSVAPPHWVNSYPLIHN